MAWRRRSWSGGNIYVSGPFLCHQITAFLSVWDSMVLSRMQNQLTIHAWWITFPDIYRSLLVTWLSGLPQENSWAVMSAVKFARHMMGCAPVGCGGVAVEMGLHRGFLGPTVRPVITDLPQIYLEA